MFFVLLQIGDEINDFLWNAQRSFRNAVMPHYVKMHLISTMLRFVIHIVSRISCSIERCDVE
jgi:hypothetical protein